MSKRLCLRCSRAPKATARSPTLLISSRQQSGVCSGHYIKQLLGTSTDPILAECWFWLAQYGSTPGGSKELEDLDDVAVHGRCSRAQAAHG
jgi:hypothetical protein